MLDRMEEWLGRHRPATLGKEGANAALERGEKTLADILSRADDYDDDSFGGQSEGSHSAREGWLEGVGEGRTDEDNLSAYFRMSEGAGKSYSIFSSTWETLISRSHQFHVPSYWIVQMRIFHGGRRAYAISRVSSTRPE